MLPRLQFPNSFYMPGVFYSYKGANFYIVVIFAMWFIVIITVIIIIIVIIKTITGILTTDDSDVKIIVFKYHSEYIE